MGDRHPHAGLCLTPTTLNASRTLDYPDSWSPD